MLSVRTLVNLFTSLHSSIKVLVLLEVVNILLLSSVQVLGYSYKHILVMFLTYVVSFFEFTLFDFRFSVWLSIFCKYYSSNQSTMVPS